MSVIKYNTLRIIIAKATNENLEINQINVKTTFLNFTLSETIYIKLLKYFKLLKPDTNTFIYCLQLHKILYKLKQTPKIWF